MAIYWLLQPLTNSWVYLLSVTSDNMRMGSACDRRGYIRNIFAHWLRPFIVTLFSKDKRVLLSTTAALNMDLCRMGWGHQIISCHCTVISCRPWTCDSQAIVLHSWVSVRCIVHSLLTLTLFIFKYYLGWGLDCMYLLLCIMQCAKGSEIGLGWICLMTTHVLRDILAVLHNDVSQSCCHSPNKLIEVNKSHHIR